jgi:phage tail sheath protein FI
MAQYRWGRLETYGYRTLVDPTSVPQWWDFGNARLEMAINAQAGAIAERYVFTQIDGRGHTIAAFGGDLRAMLVPFYENGSLYGATAEDAFQVNVGPSVNTPTTIANGELHATINVRMSPFAEYVQIYVVKVATTQSIAAPIAA